MESMRSQDIAAAFFYPLDDYTDAPPAEHPMWSLNDGDNWKSDNGFPVYAISGHHGQILIRNLAVFSGQLSDAPRGDRLSQVYRTGSEGRLYGVMSFGMTIPLRRIQY